MPKLEIRKTNKDLVPLVADLDGTLLKTDSLWEGIACMLGKRPWMFFFLFFWLCKGKVFFKKKLSAYSVKNTHLYPVNDDVLKELEDAALTGREVYIATAAYSSVAEAVLKKYSYVSDVLSSNDFINLKGQEKAKELVQRFGEKGFDYIGDSKADIPVWQVARKALVFAPFGSPLIESARSVNPDCRHIISISPSFRDYCKALRVHQWVKNFLVFVPLILAHLWALHNIAFTVLAFFSLCFCASAIYIINDLNDLSSDRVHPVKKLRPFASGVVSIPHGMLLLLLMLLSSLLVCALLPFSFFICLLSYFLLTTAYTLYIKRLLILDVVTLACLYVLRIVAGALAISSFFSNWLLAFGFFFFLGIALLKRVGDLILNAPLEKLPGRSYLLKDMIILEIMAVCSGFSSIVISVLYIDSLQAINLYSSPHILWGGCLILAYWYGRICIKAHRGEMGDDPLAFAVKDKPSLLSLLALILIIVAAI